MARENPRRVCPEGASTGIDVARVYGDIERIVRRKFGNAGVDVDDLVQETATAIVVKNASARSAFDPARSAFSHYVYIVARSKLGHMLGSQTRRAHAVVLVDHDKLAAMAQSKVGEAPTIEADSTSVGELVEQLAALAREARAHARGAEGGYYDGLSEAFRMAAELVGAAFSEEAPLPLPQRVRALLSVAGRPLTAGQMSAALQVPVQSVERALEQMRSSLKRRNRGAYELAGPQETTAPRSSEGRHDVIAMRLTSSELARLERAAVHRKTTPGLLARDVVMQHLHAA